MFNFNVKGSISGIVSDIRRQSGSIEVGAILFMASTKYDMKELSIAIENEFPHSENIGCTTTGEISVNNLEEGTVSVSVFPKSVGKIASVLMEGIGGVPIVHYKKVKEAVMNAGINFGNPKGICFSFSTGLNGGEEKVLSVIDSLFPNKKLPLIGGSAGDDLKFKETFVALNGEIYNDAAVCLFINSDNFKVYKENIFIPTGKRMQITKASVQERTVYEVDGVKASKRYAELLGIREEKLKDYFGSNPLGQLQGSEILIRSPYNVNSDGSITFYSQLFPGGIVEILEVAPNIEEVFNNTVADMGRDFRKVEGVLGVNCILRTLQFKSENRGKQFCGILSKNTKNMCGYTSYGEQLGTDDGYVHLNQTLTLVAYGQKNNFGRSL